MTEKIYLGKKMMSFNTAPRFASYDMVILNLDKNNYISSPYATVDDAKWESASNGEHIFTYNGIAWEYNGSTYSTAQLGTIYGLTLIFSSVTALKTGDTLIVNKNTNDDEMTVTVDMQRSGTALQMNCPLCKPNQRQQIANAILAKVYGKRYQPFNADGALVNPAAELGDAITAYGAYGGIYKQDITFNHLCASDIGAEITEDAETELAYENETERTYSRKFAEAEAELQILADNIEAKVSSEGGNTSFSWKLTDSGFFLYSNGTQVFKCDASGVTVNGDGTFTGNVYAGNIRSNGYDGYGGSFNGAGLTGGSVGTGQTSGGINASLGYANFAQGVFNAINTASYVKTSYIQDPWGYNYHPFDTTINGISCRIYAWTEYN